MVTDIYKTSVDRLSTATSTDIAVDIAVDITYSKHNPLDVFLKFSKTDKVEQFGERSASQAREYNLWVNYTHFAAYVSFFLPLDYL